MKRLYCMMGFLVVVLTSGCAYKHAALVTPVVTLPDSTSNSQMQQAVRKSLVNHGWTIDSETAGTTTAHIQQKKLSASVRVDYNEKQATVRHMDSKNLNYEKSPDGQERIHNHYNFWANTIANDIRRDLNPSPPTKAR
jgi:hypothetical protein